MDQDTRESLSDILGFMSTPNLGKYLGIPIRHPNSSSQDFNFVLDRVKQKLAGWKVNLLSLAGKAVLVQTSTSTIPAYTMQCSFLPDRILQGVDRVNRNFLWGSTDLVKKMHWVGWHKVTKPRSEGGLGLQTAKGRNIALLSKLNWRFHMESNSPWARVLRAKYCTTHRLQSRNERRLPCSRVWSALKKGSDTFNRGVRWVVGSDSNLKFWLDNWISKGSVRQLIHGPLSLADQQQKIKDILKDGVWDWSCLSFEIPLNIKFIIQATPCALNSTGGDRVAWSALA